MSKNWCHRVSPVRANLDTSRLEYIFLDIGHIFKFVPWQKIGFLLPVLRGKGTGLGNNKNMEDEKMAKALILWSSRTGNTSVIGNLIAEGLRGAGCEVVVRDVKYVESESELSGYDALVLGSSTFHGEMNDPMKSFLFMAEKADLSNVVGGAFGAFEWSNEASDRIFETMKHTLKMRMVRGPLLLKSASQRDGILKAHEYGKDIAALIAKEP
jgi:flavorubredoxin